ncbi:MAG: glycoside hydrolase family 1 protein [Acidimicrobiia bacterium]
MSVEPTSSDPHLPSTRIEFPDGFLWGTACAAHQVEGSNTNNDWWDWEHKDGSICADSSGDACDYWNRYEEDYDLLVAAGGQGLHRFSLEWSRIEPAEGEWSEAALDRYRAMCDALLERGIQPMVTFHHFTTPRWAVSDGGWTDDRIVDRFARFCAKAAAALGPQRLPWACTINEPGVVASLGYFLGMFPPGLQDIEAQARATANLIRAHAAAVDAIKSASPDTQVGITLAMQDFSAADPEDPADAGLVDLVRHRMEDVYVQGLATGEIRGLVPVEDEAVGGLAGTSDYVGCQYYMRQVLSAHVEGFQVPELDGSERTLMGYASYPPGLGVALRNVAGSGLPVIVTENGVAVTDDRRRCAWIAAHLGVAHDAVASGDVDLRGYVYWSLTDNFEWVLGYMPTFGLVGIDRDAGLARRPRPSLDMFGRIAAANAVDPALVASYVGDSTPADAT